MSRSLRIVFLVSCLIWIGSGCWAGYLVGRQQVIVGSSHPHDGPTPREYICDKCRKELKLIAPRVSGQASAMLQMSPPTAPLFVLAPDGKPVIKICSHELTELLVWAMDIKDGEPFYAVPREGSGRSAVLKECNKTIAPVLAATKDLHIKVDGDIWPGVTTPNQKLTIEPESAVGIGREVPFAGIHVSNYEEWMGYLKTSKSSTTWALYLGDLGIGWTVEEFEQMVEQKQKPTAPKNLRIVK